MATTRRKFLYGESVERSVCVHPQAIVEVLRKVYGATRLLREIQVTAGCAW